MSGFCVYSNSVHIVINVCVICAACLQTVVLVFCLYRGQRQKEDYRQILAEAGILAHIVLQLLMMSGVQRYVYAGAAFTAKSFYAEWRYLVTGVIVIEILLEKRHIIQKIFIAVILVCSLPAAEIRWGSLFVYIYVFDVFFWIGYGLYRVLTLYHKIDTELSILSIKEAIDNLDTALMFCRSNGSVILINRRMQQLALELSGGEILSEGELEKWLRERPVNEFYYLKNQEIESVYRIGERVWRLKKEKISIPFGHGQYFRKQYQQISLTDVTLQWRMIQNLQEQNDQIQENSCRIKNIIRNMRLYSEQEEEMRYRVYIHDILGQKLAVLLQGLLGNMEFSRNDVIELSESLMEELSGTGYLRNSNREWQVLEQVLKRMGITVHIDGSFPEADWAAHLFVKILTEGTTNAILHGFATEIWIVFEERDGMYSMKMWDSGIGMKEIKEGSGIMGMRRQMQEAGGQFSYWCDPFTIYAAVPVQKKEKRAGDLEYGKNFNCR